MATLRKINADAKSPSDPRELESLTVRAQQVYDTVDVESENTLLHDIRVVKALHPADLDLNTSVFDYAFIDQAETATLYWVSRIHTLRICQNIDQLVSAGRNQSLQSGTQDDPTPSIVGATPQQLQTEQARLATNVLMSWQNVRTHGSFLLSMSLSSVLILVWGAFRDIETYQGKPVQHVREWIMQMYAEAARGLPVDGSEEQMDQTSGLLCGGPVKGFMVKIRQMGRQEG